MTTENTGRLFVVVQAILLIGLIALPKSTHWPTPSAVNAAGIVIVLAGIGLVLAAATDLGAALTATPVPKVGGHLRTGGLYGYVRHPIYSGVLLAVAGATMRSGNLVTLATAGVLLAFFTMKAHWEEARLAERYGEYHNYALSTPRFVPRFWKRPT